MAATIDYIWQSTFCLLFFFGIYHCFLKGEKAFLLTRVFILLAPILALLFPLVEIPVSFAKPDISLEHTLLLQSLTALPEGEAVAGTFGLPEFTVENTRLPLLLGLRDYLIIGYLLMVAFLGLRLFWQYARLRMLLWKGWYQTTYDLKNSFFLVPTFGLAPVFSFFDKLFWDDTLDIAPEEKAQILKHETGHIRQGHSWDLLFYNLLGIFFWFNPAIRLMRSALVDTHEYLADAHALKGTTDRESYRQLVVRIAIGGMDLPMGSYFTRSSTLKRIMMMKKPDKTKSFSLIMVLLLSAMLMGMVSIKTMPEAYFSALERKENIEMIKAEIAAVRDSIQVDIKVERNPSPLHYEYVSGLEHGVVTAQIGPLQYRIADISDKDEYRMVLEMLQVFKNNSSFRKNYGMDRLFRNPAQMPVPEAGREAFTKFLSDNLRMPAEAAALGVDGILYVEFIVDSQGNLLSPVIRKSLGMGLDDEIIRILSLPTVPAWIPGREDGVPVNSLMTLPVQFTSGRMESSKHPSTKPFFSPSQVLNGEPVYDRVPDMPSFAGGMEGWENYLKSNLKYPEAALRADIEGTVYVALVIDKEGKISDPFILRGIGGGADEEAIRLVRNSPDWTPGKLGGQQVHVKIRIPIQFKLPHGADASNKKAGLLDTVRVKDLGSDPDFALSTSERNRINIIIQDGDQLLVNGRKISWEDVKMGLAREAEKMKAEKVETDQIIASIQGNEKTKMGRIQDIQTVLRSLDIRKVRFSNYE